MKRKTLSDKIYLSFGEKGIGILDVKDVSKTFDSIKEQIKQRRWTTLKYSKLIETIIDIIDDEIGNRLQGDKRT